MLIVDASCLVDLVTDARAADDVRVAIGGEPLLAAPHVTFDRRLAAATDPRRPIVAP